jgi:RNA polymerase sigma factor for flagellar operon FliA
VAGHGSAAEDSLIEIHLPLIKTVLGRLAMTLPAGVDPRDLHSAGLRGLLLALRRFNPRTGTGFLNLARRSVQETILEQLSRLDSGRPLSPELQQAARDLEPQSPATTSSASSNLPLGDYRDLVSEVSSTSFVCLDSVTSGTVALEDNGSDLATLIADHIERLPEMQRQVLALYYYEDLRLSEIADVLALSEERVRQIHEQAILTLKSLLPASSAPASSRQSSSPRGVSASHGETPRFLSGKFASTPV